jgi:hypothetical protein
VGRAWQSAVGDAVPVDVTVACPLTDGVQLFGPEDLASVDAGRRIRQRSGHPQVHAEIEVTEDEDGRLQPVGAVEGELRILIDLDHGAGQQDGVTGVAVG